MVQSNGVGEDQWGRDSGGHGRDVTSGGKRKRELVEELVEEHQGASRWLW